MSVLDRRDLPAAQSSTHSGSNHARPLLGSILIESRAITADQLSDALARQSSLKLSLGRALVLLQYATDESVQRALAWQHGLPFVDLERVAVDRGVARAVSRAYARRHNVLPYGRRGDALMVAMTDPAAAAVVDDLRRHCGAPIDLSVATGVAMQRAFRRAYDEVDDGPAATRTDAPGAPEVGDAAEPTPHNPRADALLRRLIGHALRSRCSDVHLEMLQQGLSVRYRVDGVLRPPHFGDLQEALDLGAREIVSRIKVLARLDIAERRRPQDGSFRFALDPDHPAASDLRVSILPTYTGESVVIRLLDGRLAPRSIGDLDLSPDVAAGVDRILDRSSGIFLVTGPTGSGKSTTLYACLCRLHRPEIRILTAEDPVEYVYDGLSQCEVRGEIGNTFARLLRSFLRHDPEVIMVGEIRDEDTAQMAFRAAQTGHLLLSTLHTNTALSALSRLVDLGVDRALIGASLAGVMSQRLVRRLCLACRQPAESTPDLVSEFFPHGSRPAALTFYRAVGCADCGFTGYRGRQIVADLWTPDEADAARIRAGAPFDELHRGALRTTVRMADDARARLAAGTTTMEELRRALPCEAIGA